MLRELSITQRSYPLVAPFRIARGVKYAADVVTVELRQDGGVGRGESVPYGRYGESVASVLDEMEALRAELVAGMGRYELQARLPPGAARNALDAWCVPRSASRRHWGSRAKRSSSTWTARSGCSTTIPMA